MGKQQWIEQENDTMCCNTENVLFILFSYGQTYWKCCLGNGCRKDFELFLPFELNKRILTIKTKSFIIVEKSKNIEAIV